MIDVSLWRDIAAALARPTVVVIYDFAQPTATAWYATQITRMPAPLRKATCVTFTNEVRTYLRVDFCGHRVIVPVPAPW